MLWIYQPNEVNNLTVEQLRLLWQTMPICYRKEGNASSEGLEPELAKEVDILKEKDKLRFSLDIARDVSNTPFTPEFCMNYTTEREVEIQLAMYSKYSDSTIMSVNVEDPLACASKLINIVEDDALVAKIKKAKKLLMGMRTRKSGLPDNSYRINRLEYNSPVRKALSYRLLALQNKVVPVTRLVEL